MHISQALLDGDQFTRTERAIFNIAAEGSLLALTGLEIDDSMLPRDLRVKLLAAVAGEAK